MYKQVSVMHRSIWTVTALVMALGCVLALINVFVYPLYSATLSDGILTLVVLTASATGAACIYSQEHDNQIETALSTPTSLRVVLLFRLLLVLAYNILLAFGVSSFIASINGEGVGHVIQLWLVPLLCLSLLSMSLSVLTSSRLAVQTMLLLEIFQTNVLVLDKYVPTGQIVNLLPVLHLADWSRWYTNPLILPLALLCAGLAIFSAPRQLHLQSQ
jgi:hypothetical protein